MEGLAPFLLFVLFMILNIYTGKKRQEQRKRQQQENPEIYNNPPTTSKNKKNLDYMMAKPTTKEIMLDKESILQNLKQQKIDSSAQYIDEYTCSLSNNHQEKFILPPKNFSPTKDYIQQTEIKNLDKEKTIQIDIEREHIMNAIMYAQVLEQPKSLAYLRRFGIKRIIHKD